MKESDEIIEVNLDRIISERIPKYYKWIPRPLIRLLEKTICQDDLNRELSINAGKTGPEFCHSVLSDLNVSYKIEGAENLPTDNGRRYIFVSNHPLGGLDGMVLIDFINARYSMPIHFIVNDLLSAVKPLENVFLPVNKHGSQSRDAATNIDTAFDSDNPVIMFPAGLCSRRHDGVIADLTWNKMFVNRAIRHQREIIPLYFDGCNSSFFYKFARLREWLGIKFNFEMVLLPSEVFKSRGKQFTIKIGKPIDHRTLKGGHEALATAEHIRSIVYNL